MAKSIHELIRIANDEIKKVVRPGGVDNRVEGELFEEILSVIQSMLTTSGTLFQDMVTPSSPGPSHGLTGNLAYISTQVTPGTYTYTEFGNKSIVLTADQVPALLMIMRINGVWTITPISLSMERHLYRDVYLSVVALPASLSLKIQHGGLPDNAHVIIRRRKKNLSHKGVDPRKNQKRWTFFGLPNGGGNTISDLGAIKLPIPKEAGIYTIDLKPILHFVRRTEVAGVLKKIRLSGNRYNRLSIDVDDLIKRNRIYQDLAIQVAYSTGSIAPHLNQRWRFGDMIHLRYIAVKGNLRANSTNQTHDIYESLTIK